MAVIAIMTEVKVGLKCKDSTRGSYLGVDLVGGGSSAPKNDLKVGKTPLNMMMSSAARVGVVSKYWLWWEELICVVGLAREASSASEGSNSRDDGEKQQTNSCLRRHWCQSWA